MGGVLVVVDMDRMGDRVGRFVSAEIEQQKNDRAAAALDAAVVGPLRIAPRAEVRDHMGQRRARERKVRAARLRVDRIQDIAAIGDSW